MATGMRLVPVPSAWPDEIAAPVYMWNRSSSSQASQGTLGIQSHCLQIRKRARGFVGYSDADPSNVSFLVHGAEMRVAETRAVNRALRKSLRNRYLLG